MAMAGATAPSVASAEFLKNWGRAIMRFWNDQGPDLPSAGEGFAAYWRGKFAELDEPTLWSETVEKWQQVAADTAETLALYQDEAQAWWQANGRKGTAPPDIEPAAAIIPAVVGPIKDLTKWVALGVGAVALVMVVNRTPSFRR
jgi:hypothetical protein